jgi:ABC-type bacteriocin/lantibiotic exporter with double-glycine peptidase domain
MRQTSISDCGATCLYMILKYYGGFETLDNLKKLTHTTKEGTSMWHLKEAAKKLGFEANAYKGNLEEIKKQKLPPFIAHVLVDEMYYHYVLVYKIRGKKLWIADPSTGYIKVMKEESFLKIFQNTILVLYLQKPLLFNQKDSKMFRKWFSSFFSKYKTEVIKIAILSLFITLFEILTLSSFYVFSKIANKSNIHLLYLFSICLIFSILIKNILELKRKNKIISYEKDTMIDLKKTFWMNIFNLPYCDLEKKSSGEAFAKLEEVDKQSLFLLQSIIFCFFDLLTFLFITLFLIFKKIIFLLFIGYCLLEFIFQMILSKKEKEVLLTLKKIESYTKQKEMEIMESLLSIKEVNLSNPIQKLLNEERKRKEEEKRKTQKTIFKYQFIHGLLIQFYFCVYYFISFLFIIKGQMNIEDLFIVAYLFPHVETFFQNLLNLFIQKEEVRWILEGMEQPNKENKNLSKLEKIEFKQSSFLSYGNLKNISFTLKKNRPVLLLGKSGIGKTTLALAIKGCYFMDGKYVNGVLEKEKTYQERVIYVSSQNYMYTASLKENILMGRNILEEKFKAILKMTHVDKIIKRNPKLYLFENGQNLSSGEKQKIALARSLLSDFDVLILDEALNKIDEEEEKQIMKSLLMYFQNKLILVISHRKNVTQLFSKVVILTDHGQLKTIKGKEKICLNES